MTDSVYIFLHFFKLTSTLLTHHISATVTKTLVSGKVSINEEGVDYSQQSWQNM